MARLILHIWMSLDGFIAGPKDDADNPLGINGLRLHKGFSPQDWPTTGPDGTVFDEVLATGAVVTGRRTAELAGFWDGDHHDGVPVFVPAHERPAEDPPGQVRYVTDGIESCIAQAKAAAGARDVLLHGAYTARECLRAGVLDLLDIHLVPVLLGGGRLLFENLGTEHVELDLVRTLEGTDALHLRYQVRRP
ncbi:dihydrofolate reductase family protein [Amycolatopsis sp.]|uniref:dihydrofolate reductase family protein n=1 Tax=Amycolatopsis sp. TaxID=37632 RepID=UPI002C730181|nr:dihydrofolate reductase family protein [Amycolatopsis sp.]HVV14372.1 dihydrofolate reductase family protein [Amycolatopsis sp.]